MTPPLAEKRKHELTIHGEIRTDYYYWLNNKNDPDVIRYLREENEYTKQILKHTETLQNELFNEMVGRIKQDDSSVPYKDNGYYYYVRFEEGKEYPIYCRKITLDSDEQVLLNVNEMAAGHAYYNVSGLSVSQDNKILSYGVDTSGRRVYEIYFKNLESGELLEDKLLNNSGHGAWHNDNQTIFYTVKDDSLRANRIFMHRLGENSTHDQEIYHESDDAFHITVYKTKSDKYLMIGLFSTVSSEYRFLDADRMIDKVASGDSFNIEFKVFYPRTRDLEYYVEHYKDKFFLRTNYEAKNFQLMETPVNQTGLEHWKTVIAERSDTLLQDFEMFNEYLTLQERKNGLTQIRIIGHNDNSNHYLDFGEPAYAAYFEKNPDPDSDCLRYSFTSLKTPNSIIEYNMKTKVKKVLKQDIVLGGYNKEDYLTERGFANAEDGSLIPISLIYKKGILKDGSNPLLLYGYGAYAMSMEPMFSITRVSLLDRGFVYAIAHIRGGEEMGRHWYEEGKLLNKKNTFTDFIACAEYVIQENYTSKEKLCIMGGSAGGLLIGAVLNMRPDLFKAAVAAVPFVDVVTTMLDESIPLTTGEFDEWGNPKDKEYYDYILSYSPYDNVGKKEYPALLVITGLYDSQVQYWEPAKWTAKLREYKSDKNPLLLHINMDAGHAGASGRFRRLKEIALEYAFLLDIINK